MGHTLLYLTLGSAVGCASGPDLAIQPSANADRFNAAPAAIADADQASADPNRTGKPAGIERGSGARRGRQRRLPPGAGRAVHPQRAARL